MQNLWERFDTIADPTEVMEAKSQFEPIDAGEYEVVLEELSAAESKLGLPMLKGKFRLITNNRILFYNQMLQNLNYPNMTAVNIAEAVDFLGGIIGEEVEFTGLAALGQLVSEIPVGSNHLIKVSYGAKDVERAFPKVKILQTEGEELLF